MKKNLVSINDIPPAGKEFSLDDQQIWLEPIKEFNMPCRIDQPLSAKFFVMPSESGVLIRGTLAGSVIFPCNRCAEDAKVLIDSHFDEFEEIPEVPSKTPVPGEEHIVFERNIPMLDLDGIAWEQFMLALPTNPLCREDCKGLCGTCGVNLNEETCQCDRETIDPRLAPLANLKIDRE